MKEPNYNKKYMVKRIFASSFRKLLLLIVAIALIPSLAIIIFTGIEYGSVLEQEVRAKAVRQVETLAMVQNTIMETVHHTLSTLALLPAFTEGEKGRQERILRQVLEENPEYVNITVTDTTGIVTVSAKLEPGTDLSERDHIQRAIGGESFTAGEFIIAQINNEAAFPFAVPIKDNEGNIIGVLSAIYRLSTYREFFKSFDLPEESFLGITDRYGIRIFFYPEKSTNPIGKPIKADIWKIIGSGSESGTMVMTGSDGMSRYYAFRRIKTEEGKEPYLNIVIGIPEQSARHPATRILIRNLLLMAVVAIFSMIMAAFIGYVTIGSKLLRMAKTVTDIRNGKLSARTHLEEDSEIGMVSKAIDGMAEALEERNDERDRNEKKLSEAIEEREMLLREVHHRVKNNLQLILSIIHLEKENSRDIETFSRQIEHRIRAMSSIHEMMYQSHSLKAIDMRSFLERLSILGGYSYDNVTIKVDAVSCPLSLERAITISLITNELIINSVKYGKDINGHVNINITFFVEAEKAMLIISDRGLGFSDTFDPHKSTSLGMQLILTLVAQIGGEIDISNSNGAVVTILFPLEE
jgi:two-component sensor histidine kinase